MKYPIGIQSFDQLIEDGYVYVDKTDLVYKLTSAPFWQESVSLHAGELLSGPQGAVSRTGHRQSGDGMGGASGFPCGLQRRQLCQSGRTGTEDKFLPGPMGTAV